MASQGAITKGYVSALASEVDTREIDAKIKDIYRDDELTDILTLADRKKPVSTGQPTYISFVDEGLFLQGDTTGATVTGSGTTSVTTTLTAATSGFARKQDLVLFPNAVVGQVYSVTTNSGQDTLVIKSVGGGNITHTAGQTLNFISIAMGERSDAPTNLRFGMTKYSNKWQIFSETSQITDVQTAATLTVSINGQNKWTMKDQVDKKIRLKGMVNAAFWAGDISATTFSDANPTLVDQNIVSGGGGGGATQATRGIDKYIQAYGITDSADTLGTVDVEDLDAIIDGIEAARGSLNLLAIGSNKALRPIESYFTSLGTSGVSTVRLTIDGNVLDTRVKQFKRGAAELNFASMPIFNHPTLFAGTRLVKSVYFMPYNEQAKIFDGDMEPAIRVRYVPNQIPSMGSELIEEAQDGAYNPIRPTGTAKEWKTVYTTRQGIEILNPSQFARLQTIS